MVGVTALTVYQDALDVLSRAIMTGESALLLARIKLPYMRRTMRGETVVETPEDMLKEQKAFAQSVKGLGATQLVALATDAEFLSENYIVGHHETHTLKDAVPVINSYTNRMVLRRENGIWKMLELESLLDNPHWPIQMPRLNAPRPPADSLTSPLHDARKLAVDPMTIYQSFLDDLSNASASEDFDAYCRCLGFPYSSHTDTLDTILSTPDDVRPFFDLLQSKMRDKGADRLVRTAEAADFLSSDLICGYHVTDFRAGKVSVFGPVKSRMLLRCDSGNWHLKSVTNSISDAEYPYTALKPSKALVTLRHIQERTRA